MMLKDGYVREKFISALYQSIAITLAWRRGVPVIKYVFALSCDCGGFQSFTVEASKVHQFLEGALAATDIIDNEMDNCARAFVMFHEKKGGQVRKWVGALIWTRKTT